MKKMRELKERSQEEEAYPNRTDQSWTPGILGRNVFSLFIWHSLCHTTGRNYWNKYGLENV